MIKELAARVQRIKPSPTLAVSARADELIASGKNIINLSVGEPDFDTPEFIRNAAIQAINEGQTRYTAVDGTSGLKKAIINKFARDNQLTYQPEQVIVSCGAKHSFYNLFAAILNPGDEVIIPAPYWVSYPDMVKLCDGIPVIVKADIEQEFKITPAQLEAAITSKTRMIILNSPSNPTGVGYTRNELKALGAVLTNYPNIGIVTDDIYESTYWGKEPFCNILMACPELYENTIVINGASKAYAMTGWRIGYAAGPAKVISAMKKIQSQSTSNPCSISQAAVEAGLNGDQSCIATMTEAYKERHDFILSEFKKIPGVQCIPSTGTFYTFPRVVDIIEKAPNINNDIELADYLLNEASVAVVPGSAFGAPGYLRLSYATSMEKLITSMKSISEALAKLTAVENSVKL
ncbi:MAG: pyridoxal phosphate-dependent aminotransferase [Gammaproteobacteria bacterium]|nr:pyridoxal phosphate-dependent aminotransferase [Gammaproteobacteria bacterium]